MKATGEPTRNGRYMIRATTDDGRAMRLSVAPDTVDWYSKQYASAWPRRIARDYAQIGALDPRAQLLHTRVSRTVPALIVCADTDTDTDTA